jgi:hypothetical protein
MRPGRAIVAGAVGATAFWAPAIAIQALTGTEFGKAGEPLWLTALLPCSTVVALLSLRRLFDDHDPSLPAAMLAGIWLSGPLVMLGPAFFYGDGSFSAIELGACLLLFPFTTIFASVHDGSLFALGAATLAMLHFAGQGREEYYGEETSLDSPPESTIDVIKLIVGVALAIPAFLCVSSLASSRPGARSSSWGSTEHPTVRPQASG